MHRQVVVWEAGDSTCKCLTRLLLLIMPPEATADAISDHMAQSLRSAPVPPRLVKICEVQNM